MKSSGKTAKSRIVGDGLKGEVSLVRRRDIVKSQGDSAGHLDEKSAQSRAAKHVPPPGAGRHRMAGHFSNHAKKACAIF